MSTFPTTLFQRCATGLAALFLLTAASVTPASAQLRICNQSTETISVAVAYIEPVQQERQWVSRGWFVTKAGECSVVVGGPLTNRFYYVRGTGTAGTTWGGANRFCTTADRFRYVGDNGCEAAGFRTENFVEVDTGDATTWTFTLTQAPSTVDPGRDTAKALRVGWRRSALDETTQVMRIVNDRSLPVGLQLQCRTRSGVSKWLSVSVPANGVAEVGFLEGWPGNFIAGESCDAFYGTERVWSVVVG